MSVRASTKEHRKSTSLYAIATRAGEGASIMGGTPQEHEAILDCKGACENVSVSKKMLQEHEAILDCKAKGESKG